ncbi:MAG: hypothetical protein WCW44_03620 [archaeon]|jgi:hypothetical protein
MAEESNDALKEANQIALELGDKKKSTDSTSNQTKSTVVSVQTKTDSTKPQAKSVQKKSAGSVKKKKVVKKVVVKKKVVLSEKSKAAAPVLPYSKTTLVDIAAENPVGEESASETSDKRVFENDSVELKNPLSEDKYKGGLIETLGGLAMVLIGIEVVIIILLLISAFFK